ncbi:MAG: T9SS type A sorting domain-containing protein [Ignavibacteriae bacterium]|nr:T9SS type A sorting domain-containing protein [Ignavibacteriota bacterium]MCB9215473.1 T9SS type A sorting domain-containing protein [Ignavibacteria bacterium]
MRVERRLSHTRSLLLSLAACLLFLGVEQGRSQGWEYVYGSTTCEDYAYSIIPASAYAGGGECSSQPLGFASVGSTMSTTTTDCSQDRDVYVVRTTAAGALVWSMSYDIGGDDFGYDIKEVSTGGFIITGQTQNRPADGTTNCFGGTTATDDAFLLRIDQCGNVLWVKIYGTPLGMEEGREVVEATVGDPTGLTPSQVGDFVVAGSFFDPYLGIADALLFRVDANGNLIWDQTYGGIGGDYFRSLVEAKAVGAGDIIAAGGSVGQQIPGVPDIYVVRVNGTNGLIGLPPQGAIVYGGAGSSLGESVIELQTGVVGAPAGNIVVAGSTKSAPPPPALPCGVLPGTWPNGEIVLLETGPGLGFVADILHGDQCGGGTDRALGLAEILTGASAGDLIVTGGSAIVPGNIDDAFLLQVTPAPLPIPLPAGTPALGVTPGGLGFFTYGGVMPDMGNAVIEVTSPPYTQPGFAVAGLSGNLANATPADRWEYYLFMADLTGSTDPTAGPGCGQPNPILSAVPGLPLIAAAGVVLPRINSCDPSIVATSLNYALSVCPPPPPSGPKLTPDLPTSTMGESGGDLLTIYPNPALSGSTLQLRAGGEDIDGVTLFDIVGRTVREVKIGADQSVSTYGLKTAGLPTGEYVIAITAGGKRYTQRVVLLER